jgi:hypothetical protein
LIINVVDSLFDCRIGGVRDGRTAAAVYDCAIYLLIILSIANVGTTCTHPLNQQSLGGTFISGKNSATPSRGWEFVVDAPSGIFVHELCQRTPVGGSGPNTNQAQTIVLFDLSSATLLNSVTADPNIAANGEEGWRCYAIPKRLLSSGFSGIIAVHGPTDPDGPYVYATTSPGSPWAPTGAVRYVQGRSVNGQSYTTMPTTAVAGYMIGMADFGYTLGMWEL